MVIGTMNNAGTVLLTIADMSIIEAEVEVDETDIPTVQLGQVAKVRSTRSRTRRSPARSPRSATARSRPTTAGADRADGDELQGHDSARQRDPRSASRLHLHRRHHHGDAQAGGVGADPGDGRARADLRRQGQHRPAAEAGRQEGGRRSSRPRRPRSCKPGQTRKETEGVFVIRDKNALFLPVKTGIAGDKYFEVLDGLKEGDKVITGPFNSVRDLKDGDLVKPEEPNANRTVTVTSRTRQRASRVDHAEVPRRDLARAVGHLGRQAALVHDRARQHRRGDLDHRGGVADPRHERLRLGRHPHRRRRRHLQGRAHGPDHERGSRKRSSAAIRASRWSSSRRARDAEPRRRWR